MFNRLKSMMGSAPSKASLDKVLAASMEQIQNGNVAEGIQSMLSTVTELEKSHPDSPVLAHSYYNAAVCCLSSGQETSAIDLVKKAAAIPGTDQESKKDRLTYVMNLGEILTRMGEVAEAEKYLQMGLEERELFYGASHPGVAFGLTPLASNLLAQGRAAEAVPLIDRAVNIDIEAGQPEVVGDLALRAFIIKAAQGPDATAFDGWESWPAELQQGVTGEVIVRGNDAADETSARIAGHVINELVSLPAESVDSIQQTNLLVVGTNAARIAGDHESRIFYGKKFLENAQQSGDLDVVINAYEGLAMAYDDIGKPDKSEETYKRAFKVAKEAQNYFLMATVLRNLGLFYSDAKRNEEAAKTLKLAHEAAMKSGDDTMVGRCLAAYGVFLQHDQQLENAEKMLASSVEKLPVVHPDRFCAMSHLIALENKSPCPCDGEAHGQAAEKILEEIVRKSLPEGLLTTLNLGDEVSVELAREPTPEEAQNLQMLIQAAMGQMRVGFGLGLGNANHA